MEVAEAGPSEDCDLFFRRVGADIPLFSPGSKIAEYTPARALAVSNRFGLTFFAHPEGFSIIRTSELVKLSQELKEYPENAGTVHEKSILKVTLPNVRILALSCDDLGLAVCAASEVRLYDTASLVNEVKVVSAEVQSVGSKNFTKDFKWCPSGDGTYLALTSEGTCSIGRLGGQLEVISSNVLAVSWSADGKYIAYVQGFTLRLRERCSNLSFDVKLPDSFSHLDDCNLQVDSIQWLDAKRMLVCFASKNEDEEETKCPFFVLSSTAGPLADRNSEQKGVIFTELFRAVSPFVLPNASGPYMLASLFASWEIVIAVCRRSIDDYFVFLNWEQDASLEKIKELQLHDDSPKVAFPVDLDDNGITGMCIDQTTVGLEVVVSRGKEAESEKLPSCPIFLFTTLEGGLSLFSFARLDKKWHSQHHVKPPSRIEEIERKHIKTSSKAFTDAAISTEAHPKPNAFGAEMHKGMSSGQSRASDQKAQAFPLEAEGIMLVGAETVPRTESGAEQGTQPDSKGTESGAEQGTQPDSKAAELNPQGTQPDSKAAKPKPHHVKLFEGLRELPKQWRPFVDDHAFRWGVTTSTKSEINQQIASRRGQLAVTSQGLETTFHTAIMLSLALMATYVGLLFAARTKPTLRRLVFVVWCLSAAVYFLVILIKIRMYRNCTMEIRLLDLESKGCLGGNYENFLKIPKEEKYLGGVLFALIIILLLVPFVTSTIFSVVHF